MSFLTRFASTARIANPAVVFKTTTPSFAVGGYRSLSSTSTRESGPVDTAKSTLKKADRIVSDAAVKGIETGETAANKIKETVGKTTSDAQRKSEELKGDAAELAGEGKGKAKEAIGEAQGEAEEMMGKAKGKAKETASNLKS